MKKSSLVICLVLSIVLFSCQNKSKTNIGETNTITFDTISVSDKHFYNNDSTQANCSISVSFIYPSQFENDSILKKVQKDIIQLYFEDEPYLTLSPQNVVPVYISNYNTAFDESVNSFKNHLDDFDGSDSFYSSREDLQGSILYNQSGFLSFQVKRFSEKMEDVVYTQYKNCVIDLQTGDYVREEDVFISDYEQALHKLFIAHLLQANNAKSIGEIDNDDVGYANLQEMMPNRNFYIDNEGLIYIFNTGEYSSPQMDAIVIKLKFDEIKHLIKDDSPIQRLIN